MINLNRSLGILNDLARKDRHRKLHVVGSWALRLKPQLILPPGVTISSMTLMEAGYLDDFAELAAFQLRGFVRGMPLQANPYLTTTVGLNEPPAPCHPSDTFDRRIAEMMNAVHSVICMFEEYF